MQDRLARTLHTRLPGLVVSREWKATDIAVLTADAKSPVALLEIKVLYSFDLTENQPNAAVYPQLLRSDLAEAQQLDHHGTAGVYALALVTHPDRVPEHLPGVIKYLGRIESALPAFGSAELRRLAAATMRQALSPLGPVRNGASAGRNGLRHLGTEVTVDYWLVGPAWQPILHLLPNRHQPVIAHALAVVITTSASRMHPVAPYRRFRAQGDQVVEARGRSQIAQCGVPQPREAGRLGWHEHSCC